MYIHKYTKLDFWFHRIAQISPKCFWVETPRPPFCSFTPAAISDRCRCEAAKRGSGAVRSQCNSRKVIMCFGKVIEKSLNFIDEYMYEPWIVVLYVNTGWIIKPTFTTVFKGGSTARLVWEKFESYIFCKTPTPVRTDLPVWMFPRDCVWGSRM